jgi:hypothetical protein
MGNAPVLTVNVIAVWCRDPWIAAHVDSWIKNLGHECESGERSKKGR